MLKLVLSPDDGALVNGELDVSKSLVLKECGLDSLVKENSSVQSLLINGNGLTSLAPLAGLRDLVWLDASNNALVQALDFKTPLCGLSADGNSCDESDQAVSVWSQGANWTGSNLEFANLSNNMIRTFENITWHANLRTLKLGSNKIDTLQDISALVNLEQLDLSENRLCSLRQLGVLPSLVQLDVRGNKIRELHGCLNMPHLANLLCANNEISVLKGLEKCSLLQILDAASNKLAFFEDLVCLQDLELLENVIFADNCFQLQTTDGTGVLPNNNDISGQTQYRKRVIYRLPQLTYLDEIPVSVREKVSAQNYYGLDLDARRKTFQDLFGDEEFPVAAAPIKDREIVVKRAAPRLAIDTIESAMQQGMSKTLNSPSMVSEVFAREVLQGLI